MMWGSILFEWGRFLNILPIPHTSESSQLTCTWSLCEKVRKWGKGEFLSSSSRVRYTVPQAFAAIKWLMPRGVSSLGDPTVPTSWISSSMLTKGCYRPWNRGLTLMSLCLERTNIWIPCWWNSGSYCTLNEDCVLGASRTTLTGVRTTLTEMT